LRERAGGTLFEVRHYNNKFQDLPLKAFPGKNTLAYLSRVLSDKEKVLCD
jgi:hypothetical protein